MIAPGANLPRAELSGRAALSCDRIEELSSGWQVLRTGAGEIAEPADLTTSHAARFRAACVPGTAAQIFGIGAELATTDHVYRCRFASEPGTAQRTLLCFDGLATLAEVWFNGERVLASTSMFEAHTLDVSALLRAENELVIRFAALQPVLLQRRPRGRWPVPLLTEKNLRFVRTTVLGHMPGFCPEAVPVGPWRSVRLVHQDELGLEQVALFPLWKDGASSLDVALRVRQLGKARVSSARLLLGGAAIQLHCEQAPDSTVLVTGGTTRRDLAPWWPHTHGTPALHPASLEVQLAGGRSLTIDLGGIGFRSVELEGGSLDRFTLRINGERLFCRGAAMPPLDACALHVGAATYRKRLDLVAAAGMNMLRVVGNFVYESDAFYRECDARGVLVFQDFMFANMDYPVADPAWRAQAEREVTTFLERTSGRSCLTVLCGGTEVAQQAAMMGLPASEWSNELFDRVLPGLCASFARGVPYAPSSPCGGALPFHVGTGLSHYYGVGGYRRPLHDPRLARPRFASECLAFANPPCEETLAEWLGAGGVPTTDPRYAARIPHDLGATWTFADVTDHYVKEIFREDAAELRRNDSERYLAFGRAAVCEAMASMQGQLRRVSSECSGALVWMLHDLHDAAGLGVIDSRGRPKAPFHALARAWAPIAVWLSDEGLDGVWAHVANDRPTPLEATLRIALFRENGTLVEQNEIPLRVRGHDEVRQSVDAGLGHFADSSYAYRFGAPSHAVVAAWLLPPVGDAASPRTPISRGFHLPLGLTPGLREDPGLQAELRELGDEHFELTIRTQRFAHSVTIRVDGFRPSDDHFHLAPEESCVVTLTRVAEHAPRPLVTVRSLNSRSPVTVALVGATS